MDIGRAYLAEHPDVWDTEVAAAGPEDLMILTYTSGTTGPPKGAMMSHRNMLFMLNAVHEVQGMGPGDELLGFLPLAHIAGRVLYTFAPLESGATLNLVESMETTVRDHQEVAPTGHFAVPRVWEKQYSTVAIKLKEATALGRFAYERALAVGRRAAEYRKRNEPLPLGLALTRYVADFLVLRNVRKLLGIDRCRWLATAAAPIAPDLIDWYWALGRPMYEVYGQTECTALATGNLPGDSRVGSVGKPLTGVEIRLSDEGEILIRSPGVIQGYLHNPEKTAETIVDDWLQGHHHHGGRQEHHAERDREPAQVLAVHLRRRRRRRQAAIPDLSRHDRSRKCVQIRADEQRAVYELRESLQRQSRKRPRRRGDRESERQVRARRDDQEVPAHRSVARRRG